MKMGTSSCEMGIVCYQITCIHNTSQLISQTHQGERHHGETAIIGP